MGCKVAVEGAAELFAEHHEKPSEKTDRRTQIVKERRSPLAVWVGGMEPGVQVQHAVTNEAEVGIDDGLSPMSRRSVGH